jgi:hypothetical protein
MTYLKRGVLLLAALSVAAAAIAAAACGSSSSDAKTDPTTQASLDALTLRVQRDEMLNAWVTISSLPLHDLDTALQGGKIDGKYVPTLRTAIRVLALTGWTDDVKPSTTKFHDDAVALLQALNAGKTADETKALSTTLHEDWHMFGTGVGNAVAKDLPADAGGPAPTAAPASSTTPSAGSTAAH